jgi:hypothetical protein
VPVVRTRVIRARADCGEVTPYCVAPSRGAYDTADGRSWGCASYGPVRCDRGVRRSGRYVTCDVKIPGDRPREEPAARGTAGAPAILDLATHRPARSPAIFFF